MPFADVIVLAIVGVVVGLAFASSRRDAHRGCSGCCASCMQAGGCTLQSTQARMDDTRRNESLRG